MKTKSTNNSTKQVRKDFIKNHKNLKKYPKMTDNDWKPTNKKEYCAKHQLNHGDKYASCYPKPTNNRKKCICPKKPIIGVSQISNCPIHGVKIIK